MISNLKNILQQDDEVLACLWPPIALDGDVGSSSSSPALSQLDVSFQAQASSRSCRSRVAAAHASLLAEKLDASFPGAHSSSQTELPCLSAVVFSWMPESTRFVTSDRVAPPPDTWLSNSVLVLTVSGASALKHSARPHLTPLLLRDAKVHLTEGVVVPLFAPATTRHKVGRGLLTAGPPPPLS